MKLTIIVEKGDNELWGRIENIPDYLPVTVGKSLKEIEDKLKELLDDYIQNEGKSHPLWKDLQTDHLEFDLAYEAPVRSMRVNMNLGKLLG